MFAEISAKNLLRSVVAAVSLIAIGQLGIDAWSAAGALSRADRILRVVDVSGPVADLECGGPDFAGQPRLPHQTAERRNAGPAHDA
ncbi:MAG: hypothetical protein NT133_16405 [Alphaproteobacteria bacterium]|nr:hypothetical protein [Alphaproteobacteria bacterium]